MPGNISNIQQKIEVMQFFFFFTLSAKVIKEKGKKEGVDTSEICDWTKRVGKLSQAGPS